MSKIKIQCQHKHVYASQVKPYCNSLKYDFTENINMYFLVVERSELDRK